MFCIVLLCVVFGMAQTNPRVYLYNKADSLMSAENFTQARYYYLLVIKQDGDEPTDGLIKQKVVMLDSTIAYQSENEAFIQLITKADSFLRNDRYIEALKFFDDAATVAPEYDYPRARVDLIFSESEGFRKQLLIYNAKQNQLSYTKWLKDIESLEKAGYEIEAYFAYKVFAQSFHGDSVATKRGAELFTKLEKSIKKFEKCIEEGEDYYQEGDFIAAYEMYQLADSINPKCKPCESRLQQINYCIKEGVSKEDDFAELFDEAKNNFQEGKYDKAYYQLSWLQKLDPQNQSVGDYISEVEDLLEVETDGRMRKFNADITLEKANAAFVDHRYEEALAGYSKLKNAYADAIDYLQFVELRIAECLNELSAD